MKKPRMVASAWLCAWMLSNCVGVATAQRLVFAHYLIYAADTIDTYKQEIQLAQSKGIDAFALNTNVWRPALADNIYSAASQLGTNFKLFFSADVHADSNGKLSPSDIVSMLSNYRTHPNQLVYKNRSFFTSWLGNDDSYWSSYGYSSSVAAWTDIFSSAGGKSLYYYIPFFATDGSYYGVLGSVYTPFGSLVDGYFAWDSSAWNYISPNYSIPQVSPGDQSSLQVSTDYGKTYMAAVSPWFFKNLGGQECCSSSCDPALSRDAQSSCPCQVKGDYQGPGLWLQKWAQIIQYLPPLVEIVTWNDWIEGHYVAPGLSVGASASGVDVNGFPHQAYLEIGKHYIDWYKQGTEPIATQDSIFLFYYTQSTSVTIPGIACGILNANKLADDAVYVAVILAPGSRAQIVLQSGTSTESFSARQGLAVFGMGFHEGQQSATYTRGSTSYTITGAQPVRNTALSSYNFNAYSTFCLSVPC